MTFSGFAQILFRADALNSHNLHQSRHPLTANRISTPTKNLSHSRNAVKWRFCVLLIYDPHQVKIQRTLTCRMIIVARSRNSQQITLANYRDIQALRFNQLLSLTT